MVCGFDEGLFIFKIMKGMGTKSPFGLDTLRSVIVKGT